MKQTKYFLARKKNNKKTGKVEYFGFLPLGSQNVSSLINEFQTKGAIEMLEGGYHVVDAWGKEHFEIFYNIGGDCEIFQSYK